MEEKLTFERARFKYCIEIFQKENERKETLEKKSQFLLSLATLIIAAMFFKLDIIDNIRMLIQQGEIPSTLIYLIYMAMIFLGISLLISLVSVLFTMWLQNYTSGYPNNIVSALFAPDTTFYKEKSEMSLLAVVAMNYALSLESNKKLNDRKAKWVVVSSLSLLIAVISLSIILSIIFIILFSA